MGSCQSLPQLGWVCGHGSGEPPPKEAIRTLSTNEAVTLSPLADPMQGRSPPKDKARDGDPLSPAWSSQHQSLGASTLWLFSAILGGKGEICTYERHNPGKCPGELGLGRNRLRFMDTPRIYSPPTPFQGHTYRLQRSYCLSLKLSPAGPEGGRKTVGHSPPRPASIPSRLTRELTTPAFKLSARGSRIMQITRREAKSAKQMLRVAPASMVTIMANTCLGSALPGRRRLGQSPHLATAP